MLASVCAPLPRFAACSGTGEDNAAARTDPAVRGGRPAARLINTATTPRPRPHRQDSQLAADGWCRAQVVVAAPRRLARASRPAAATWRNVWRCSHARQPPGPDPSGAGSMRRFPDSNCTAGTRTAAARPADLLILAVACDAPPAHPGRRAAAAARRWDAIAACVLGWLAAGRPGDAQGSITNFPSRTIFAGWALPHLHQTRSALQRPRHRLFERHRPWLRTACTRAVTACSPRRAQRRCRTAVCGRTGSGHARSG